MTTMALPPPPRSLSIGALFFAIFPLSIRAVQSVFSCPLNAASAMIGMPGTLPAYAGALGEVCGTGSFIHYWTCCDNYPFECCFNFQPWAIVFLAVIGIIVLALIVFAIGRFVIAMQREDER